MRTLIWNVTTDTQVLPEIYESTEVATRWASWLLILSLTRSPTLAALRG